MTENIKIGALVSGGGTNLQAILDACDNGQVNGEVVFVGSDNPRAKGLDRGRACEIDTFTVDYGEIIRRYRDGALTETPPADFNLREVWQKQSLFGAQADDLKVEAFLTTRAIAEKRLLEKIKPYKVDLLVLAGFMRNLTPYFIDRFAADPNHPNIMNIHPALLPAFPGIDGYGDTFRYGCKVGGCTVHFIDYGEDSGPIIGQRAFAITETDDLASIRRKGLELEWQLYPECIQMYAQKRLQLVTLTHTVGGSSVRQRKIVKIVQVPETQ
ncbi:MAG: phosphoribosylglycinamide formyltransferase [Desulfobacteraceae bacterium]